MKRTIKVSIGGVSPGIIAARDMRGIGVFFMRSGVIYLMKYYILSIVVLLTVPVLSFAAPSISFEEMNYEAGVVKQDDKAVEHAFLFVNKGDRELVIEKVTAS